MAGRFLTRIAAAAGALTLLSWLSFLSAPALAEASGVEGVASLRGELLAGVVVLAFADAGPDGKTAPLAVSDPTGKDGRYRLSLAPGSYHLAALRASGKPWPPPEEPGDLFSYYLGNPVVVEKGGMTRVGFNMVEIRAAEDPVTGKGSGVRGQVLFEGKPLARAYVHVYRDPGSHFRGMGVAALPTGVEGEFRMKLPPGRYYLVARKRRAGGAYGPPGKDDHVGYYARNPVEVREGEESHAVIETATRVDVLEEKLFTDGKGSGWLRGLIVDGAGKPVEGQYVLFYADQALSGAPVIVAGPTDGEGKFKVRATEGRFYLLARSGLGGPLEAGEWHGRYRGPGGEERIDGTAAAEVRIVVVPYRVE